MISQNGHKLIFVFRLQERVGVLQSQQTALLDVNARLLAFKSAASGFRLNDIFQSEAQLAEDQVGLILGENARRTFHRLLLGRRAGIPTLTLSESSLQAGHTRHVLHREDDRLGMLALRQLVQREEPTYLYLTYHLYYPAGTRIVTFSKRAPLPIIYKPMRPMKVQVVRERG